MNKRDEILAGLSEIKLLGTPAIGALQIISDPDADSEEVSKLLSHDPALTANTLKFANSAFFGRSQNILTVKEAIVHLGMKTISRMLLLSVSGQFAQQPVKGYDLPPGSLWESMLSTAVGTDLLAQRLQINAPAHTFTTGLIHNIGKLVLGTYLEVDAEPICDLAMKDNIAFDEAEKQVLGINHAEVGAELLKRWNLPDEIVEAVRWHHDPNQYPEDDKLVVDLVHAAEAITMMSGTGLGIDGLHYDICSATGERLKVDSTTVQMVMSELQENVQDLLLAM